MRVTVERISTNIKAGFPTIYVHARTMQAMTTSPATDAGAATGLSEPLLSNRNGVHAGALVVTPVAANGHGGKAKDKYWKDVDQPGDMAVAPDLENGGGRPLLFSNRRVKNIILYPYRWAFLLVIRSAVHLSSVI